MPNHHFRKSKQIITNKSYQIYKYTLHTKPFIINTFHTVSHSRQQPSFTFFCNLRAEISLSPLEILCTKFQRELVEFMGIFQCICQRDCRDSTGQGLTTYLTNDYAISKISDNLCFFFCVN